MTTVYQKIILHLFRCFKTCRGSSPSRRPHPPPSKQPPADVPTQKPSPHPYTMPSPRVPRRTLAGRRRRDARGDVGLRRPLDRTRAQTAVRAALLVSIASVLAVLNTAASTIAPRTRERPAGMRSRVDMPYKMAAVSDLDFRLLFRMERDDCWALLGLIRGRLETNEEMAILSSGQPISAECRLAMALRILAGASYLDVMLAFGV